jgi:hypothetical protein
VIVGKLNKNGAKTNLLSAGFPKIEKGCFWDFTNGKKGYILYAPHIQKSTTGERK